MNITRISAILLAAGLIGAPALAQDAKPQPQDAAARAEARKAAADRMFTAADTNRDGNITREEWDAWRRSQDGFSRMDTDKDGRVSRAELEAHHAKMGKHRGDRRGPGPHRGHGDRNPLARIDTDKDGTISLAEWKAAGRDEAGFTQLDANKDGKLSAEELRGGMKARRSR